MAGLKVELNHPNETPELVISYSLELPQSLYDVDQMEKIRAYLTDETDSLDNAIQTELKEFKEGFYNTLGADIGEASLSIETQETQIRRKYDNDPALMQKIQDFYDDALVSASGTLIFEAIKNTYDSVIIRNYLATLYASMTPEEFQEKEPLAYAVIQRYGIELTPVKTLSFTAYATSDTIRMEDNGAGKALVDAFKRQHSHAYRYKSKLSHTSSNADDIYSNVGKFKDLGLRTGGFGKGRRVEELLLQSIGATSNFNDEDTLGIHLSFKKELKPELATNPSAKKGPTLSVSDDMPIATMPLSFDSDLDSEEDLPIQVTAVSEDSDSESEDLRVKTVDNDSDSDSEAEESSIKKIEEEEEPSALFVPTIKPTSHSKPKWSPNLQLDANTNGPNIDQPNQPVPASAKKIWRPNLTLNLSQESIEPLKKSPTEKTPLAKEPEAKPKWRPGGLKLDFNPSPKAAIPNPGNKENTAPEDPNKKSPKNR